MAYPTSSYYDPNRPSWLPYWIDDFTESALKYGAYPGAAIPPGGYKDPPMPPAISAKDIVSASSIPNMDANITQNIKEWQGQNQKFFDALAISIDSNTGGGGSSTNWWVIGAAGVGVFAAYKLLFGRR